ncbi:MAG: hypothetical protein WAV79_10985 [Anaerolineae bacterium]
MRCDKLDRRAKWRSRSAPDGAYQHGTRLLCWRLMDQAQNAITALSG